MLRAGPPALYSFGGEAGMLALLHQVESFLCYFVVGDELAVPMLTPAGWSIVWHVGPHHIVLSCQQFTQHGPQLHRHAALYLLVVSRTCTGLQEAATHPNVSIPALSLPAQSNFVPQRVFHRAVPSFGGSDKRDGKMLYFSGCGLETFLP